MPIRARTLVEEAELALKRGSVASIVQLLQLIRDVNPTPRGLDEAARRRRYALKARLQSLLIRRFGNELRVVPGDEPGVASILRPQSGADACHAVIVDLDEDARSWVTYQIDTGTIGGANAAATLGSPSTRFNTERTTATQNDEVTRLSAAGQQALAEYDYEQAAIHFQQAQQMSQGAIEPTRVLLEFWIDQMGGDKAALELEPHLPRATLASLEIRALLGVAAARTGDVPRAERLVRGLDGQRVAEVVALIAREALKASDPESAVPWIAQLRSLDPMHPAVRECEHKLQNLRDEARFAAEAHLERLLTSGSLDEAERCANAILQRWPRSEGASRWLRERVAERAGLSAIEALEQAKCEQEAGALRSALVILSNALTPELDQELRSVVQGKRWNLSVSCKKSQTMSVCVKLASR